MFRIQAFIFPAALLGCLLVGWLGTTAARSLPSDLQTPAFKQAQVPEETSTASAERTAVPVQASDPSIGGDQVTDCTLSSRFPESILRWCSLIQKHAFENELPPQLIAAVMLQESGGDPQAYSHSGAVGLLQVMPRDGIAATFHCVNGPCFASRPTIAELQDPEYNIAFGTRMLAGLTRKHGSFREALHFYGPVGVEYSYADKVLVIYENYR
jgi:soluble lytic murein transglycosylase-like protein